MSAALHCSQDKLINQVTQECAWLREHGKQLHAVRTQSLTGDEALHACVNV